MCSTSPWHAHVHGSSAGPRVHGERASPPEPPHRRGPSRTAPIRPEPVRHQFSIMLPERECRVSPSRKPPAALTTPSPALRSPPTTLGLSEFSPCPWWFQPPRMRITRMCLRLVGVCTCPERPPASPLAAAVAAANVVPHSPRVRATHLPTSWKPWLFVEHRLFVVGARDSQMHWLNGVNWTLKAETVFSVFRQLHIADVNSGGKWTSRMS